jgi:Icc-related predicted phosphoesterase
MGAILAGDLYSVPGADKRGGYGDVADVWRAFGERFAWVAGVAGNHDDVGAVGGDNVHLLDGEVAELDGLRIGGVGGIISEKQRPWRRPEDEQLALVDRVIDAGVDVLVLHEGPHGDDDREQPGNAALRSTALAGDVGFTICGHSHWEAPLAACGDGQVLNVDARVVVITSGRRTSAAP